MAQSYRILHHWNQWLAQHFLGHKLLQTEKEIIAHLLGTHFGKHALLIGVPEQQSLLTATTMPCHSFLTPFMSKEKIPAYIEADFHELPILTGSVDLLMLPHTLEYIDNPRQLLSEACRVIKPEGLILICGFNPYSGWGLKKLVSRTKTIPYSANFIDFNKVKSWLQLADFLLEEQKFVLFAPPIANANIYKKLNFLERIGQKFFPFFGGVYVLIARAKVIPLTPIRLQWKQQLSGVRISTVSGHIARQSK